MGELERMTRRYTAELIEFIGPEKDVPAPDVNTNEQVMAWMMDTYSMHMRQTVTAVVTGKPINIGGSRGRREATGRGIKIVCDKALKQLGLKPEGTRVIVQGFGNVGSNAARLMAEAGYRIIGVIEVDGAIFNKHGIDVEALEQHRAKNRSITGFREAESAMEHRFGLPQRLDADGRALNTPFAVLSLGKLGGNELNYSSDIDLLYLYGDGAEPATAPISNREYFVRLAQQVTEILSRPTAEGAVFRIDLRLRPQGNEGELAIGLSNALRYYAETAHDWERQALIKVRHSAGDIQLARAFIRRVQPQVYSEEINFAAIKTALVAREKIDRKRRRQAAARSEPRGLTAGLAVATAPPE